MADSTTTRTLFSSKNRIVVQATGISDGTGEVAGIKVDRSALTGPNESAPTRLAIEELVWSTSGFNSVVVAWSNTTNTTIGVLSGDGYRNYKGVGGLRETDAEIAVRTASTGGDLIVKTPAGSANAVYDIVFVARLEP